MAARTTPPAIVVPHDNHSSSNNNSAGGAPDSRFVVYTETVHLTRGGRTSDTTTTTTGPADTHKIATSTATTNTKSAAHLSGSSNARAGLLAAGDSAQGAEEPAPEPHRDQWGGRAEFLLACIGYTVGIGNIWRFPSQVYENGGGSFLIPYFLAVLLLGIPLYLVELALGQVFQKGTYHVLRGLHWRAHGAGLATALISFLVGIYYNIIITWSLVYLFNSFKNPLPWADDPDKTSKEDAEQFFQESVLQRSDGLGDVTKIVWHLFGTLVLAWVVVGCVICKGVKSAGKAVYVTAVAPFLLLTLLFFLGVTREGAGEGIKFYLQPDWSELVHPDTWVAACNQIFFSLGVGYGTLITYASFNKPDEDVVFDSKLIPGINAFTSFFGGFAVFGMLGELARESGEEVADVVDEKTGLVFVVYPAALAQLPTGAAQLFSVCFFLMLFFLGIDSQMAIMEVVTTFMYDMGSKRKVLNTVAVCTVSFLCSLLMVTDAGYFWFELLDDYVGLLGPFGVALVEVVAATYVYGKERLTCGAEFRSTRLLLDLGARLNRQLSGVWAVAWKGWIPVILAFLMVWSVVVAAGDEYTDEAGWIQALKWLLVLSPPSLIVLGFVVPPRNYKRDGNTDNGSDGTSSAFWGSAARGGERFAVTEVAALQLVQQPTPLPSPKDEEQQHSRNTAHMASGNNDDDESNYNNAGGGATGMGSHHQNGSNGGLML
mmetsp:Transcript_2323/g.8299  ORF Transcript_2323/g.8299 Transcript_2323/m.8299 type:complete len:713 (+) Transcript_2323:144-2282(+)